MVPYILIQKADEFLKEEIVVVESMKPEYVNVKNEIRVMFKYNLDELFTLNIRLNPFYQPQSVYLSCPLSGDVKEVVEGTEIEVECSNVRMILNGSDILNIANNIVKINDISQWTIRAKYPNQTISPDIKTAMFYLFNNGLGFDINGEQVNILYDKNGIPVLRYGDTEYEVYEVKLNYFCFKVPINGEEYEIGVIPYGDLLNSSLFEDNELYYIKIIGNGKIQTNKHTYKFEDGIVYIDGEGKSYLEFVDNIYDNMKIQWLSNILTDNNIYTSVSTAFLPLIHHSFEVYELDRKVFYKGKVKTEITYDKYLNRVLRITLDRPKDSFGNVVEHSFSIVIPLLQLKRVLSYSEKMNLLDVAYIEIDGEFEPIYAEEVKAYRTYLVGTNKQYVFYLNKFLILKLIQNNPYLSNLMVHYIYEDICIVDAYMLKSVDFENKLITLSNGIESNQIGFGENNPYIIYDLESQFFNNQSLTKIFGITPNIPISAVEFDFVTPDIYDEILLAIKLTEPETYPMSLIERDTEFLNKTVLFRFSNGMNIAFVYNIAKNYYYIINRYNNDSGKDISDVEGGALCIAEIDANELRNALLTNSVKNKPQYKLFNSVEIDNDGNVYYLNPIYKTESVRYSEIDRIVEHPSYTTLGKLKTNDQVQALLNQGAMREICTGIFATDGVKFKSINIDADNGGIVLTVETEIGEKIFNFSYINGKYVFTNLDGDVLEKEISNAFSDNNIYNFSIIEFKAPFVEKIAIDDNIVQEMIDNGNLAIDGEFLIYYDGLYSIKAESLNAVNKDDIITKDFKEADFYEVTNRWVENLFYSFVSFEKYQKKLNEVYDFYSVPLIYKDDNIEVLKLNSETKYIVLKEV